MGRQILAVLPPVTPQSACQLLAVADHVPADRGLPANVVELARRLDRMRNVAPRLVRCDVMDGVLVFHKETTFESGLPAARQHIFGALRFLTAQGDAFQIIRALATPPAAGDHADAGTAGEVLLNSCYGARRRASALTSDESMRSGTVQPFRSYSARHCSAKPLYRAVAPVCSAAL